MKLAKRVFGGAAAGMLAVLLVVGGGAAANAVYYDVKTAERTCTAPKTGHGYTYPQNTSHVSHVHRNLSQYTQSFYKEWYGSGTHNSYGPYLRTEFKLSARDTLISAWSAGCF